MKTSKTKDKQKAFSAISLKSFISVVAILLSIIVVCGILTNFIPQGHFERDADGAIIADTFTQGGVKGIALWRVITAPFRVFFADGGLTIIIISLFLLIMSGIFNVIDKTNGIKAIMHKVMQKFGKKIKIVLCVGILCFMLFGSLFGLFEELVTLLPFVTLFMLSLGLDTMVGLGVCLLSACFGFSAAITNPFSVGIASSFAGISTMSGVWLRILFFIITYLLVCVFVLSYAKKIMKDPKKSLTYADDQEKLKSISNNNFDEGDENKIFKIYITFFIIALVVLALVAVIRPISGYAVPILAVTFLIGGLISGCLVSKSKKEVFKIFFKGVVSMLPAVLLIALASSVNLIMQESGVLDTIMYHIIEFLQNKNKFVSLLFIYALILILQLFIGSASAKIFLLMPILLPICSALGISANLLIVLYCMADGFSDVILPTNPVLLIGLSMSNVSYGKWVKWTWKIQLIILLLSFAVLWFGLQIGF